MNTIPDGQPYVLPPLSEYVVIEHKPKPVGLPTIQLNEWLEFTMLDPNYDVDYSARKVRVRYSKPSDFEVLLHSADVANGWIIEWEGE